jgi:hypothetical protein
VSKSVPENEEGLSGQEITAWFWQSINWHLEEAPVKSNATTQTVIPPTMIIF